MKLEDDQFILEIEPSLFVYFACKDAQGNHYDSSHTEWEDLPDPVSCLEVFEAMSTILSTAYRLFEIGKTGSIRQSDSPNGVVQAIRYLH